MMQFLNQKAINSAAQHGTFRAPAFPWRTGFLLGAILFLGLSFSGNAQIAQRGTASTAISTSASVTINRPAGVVTGDIMIATIANYCSGCTQTSAALSGWTVIAGTNIERGRATLMYKIAGSSEPASYTFSVTTSSSAAAGAIVAFSGVNSATPFDVTAPTSWTTVSNQVISTIPDITTVTGSSAVLVFGASGRITTQTTNNFTSWTSTNPALTEIFDVGHNNAGNTVAVGGAWGIRTTAGSTGNTGFTCTPNTSPRLMGGIMISLRPCLSAGAASATPTVCLNTAMTSITHSTNGATGIGTATGLPAGVSASWSSNTITISGTPTASGTFNYSIPLAGGCGSVNATGTITVTPVSVGGTVAGSASRCSGTNTTTLTLSGRTGSVVRWQSSTSPTFSGGISDIANTSTSLTVTNLTATTYYRAVVQNGTCATANSNIASVVITQPGSGNFSYSAAGFCTSAAGAQTVSSNFTGVSGTFTTTAGLAINSTTGAITPSGSTAGSYTVTYSIPASGGCAAYSTSTNITIDRAGSGSVAYSPSSLCTGTAGSVSPVVTGAGGTGSSIWYSASPGTLSISGTGVITPSTSSPGTYTVTYNRSASPYCPSYSASTTVTVNASPTISSSTVGSRCGTGSVLLGATSSTGTVYWWDSPSGGNNLASGNTFNTPSISSTTTYYADPVSVNGCFAATRTPVVATVLTQPTITSTTPGSVCGSGTATISATASAGSVSWFSSPTGGTPLVTGNTYNPAISSTTVFFAEATSAGCPSVSRSPVTATATAVPTVTSVTPGSTCGPGSVALSATASEGILKWFSDSTGGTAIGTGSDFTTPSVSVSTNFYVEANANGCPSVRTKVIATVLALPSIVIFSSPSVCGSGSVTLVVTPSKGTTVYWFDQNSGGTLLGTGDSYTTPVLSAATTYFAEARSGSCIQPSRNAFNVTVNPSPVASISADYCSVPGKTVLTAPAGMTSYSWSTGASTQSIQVDLAGKYRVTVQNAALCSATDSISVASELVFNGSFDAGNTGFTTNYAFVADGPAACELCPEGTYSIVPNANLVHGSFFGRDRGNNNGNIMVVNGSPTLGGSVWSQNNITVIPNTTYYFSAWAMSVVNSNNAVLQFSINGTQVGTVAYLPNGYSNTAGPYSWVRFYGQWNSGPATTADISIVNLNAEAGGNDFALDDISFATFSPVALAINPVVNGGSSVCENDPLILNAAAVGGASPYTYSWTGPNGFSSGMENPMVTASAGTGDNGTYTLTITDGFGCQKVSTVSVSVSPIPALRTVSAAAASVCSGQSTSIVVSSSEIGVYYQLRNDAGDVNIGNPVVGTGANISLPTGTITANTTFGVVAIRYPGNCDREMSNTVTVSISVTPELTITNQAVCSGTVNLTAAAVTAGSTGGGTLTYWNDAGATSSLSNPAAVATSGTYFIRSSNGACSDIEPVIVSISPTPSAAFTYSLASYCTTGSDPVPTVTGASGVFSSIPAGIIFVNANTGEIDLSASTPGTYTVRNTVTPVGACAAVFQDRTVTITAAPLAGFSYVSNDLCQSADALNASPIFEPGAAAGTFSTSAGLSLNTSTGVINVSASTPGNYAVVNTRAAQGGCPAFRDTTFLDINPYIFTGSVTSGVSANTICLNEKVDLYSGATSYATVLLREGFNGSINNWVRTNSSTGGTPGDAAWTLRDNSYSWSGVTFRSNDNSRFYLSNSQDQGGGTTLTYLRSPVLNTIGFSTLSLDFFHFFDARNSGDVARVQVSTDNNTWTNLASYTGDIGSSTGFQNQAINLNAYIGLPTVYIRFFYTATNDRYWAIDNVSVTGNSINYQYNWSSSPVGFASNLQNPTDVAPNVNTFYTVTATNSYGCSNPGIPVPVTVNPLPSDNAGEDKVVCGSASILLGKPATPGNTFTWTPAASLDDTTLAQPLASPAGTATYLLTETITATGCSDTNSVTVTVIPLPVILSAIPGERCGGGTVALSASSSTGTLKWFDSPVGGTELGSSTVFTTPSISATTTYYAEATSVSCNALTRMPVLATVNAPPTIISQLTPAATYSQDVPASELSVTAAAGSGTISGYQWYSNAAASVSGGTLIPGATTAGYTPSTAVSGTLYYYCVVNNSNGCSVASAVSGAIEVMVSPVISGINGTIPSVAGQTSATGYRGQTIEITGTNFESNATVTINGVSSPVTFVNSGLVRVVVNNAGANSSGNLVLTNPSNGAFVSRSFQFMGYITSGTSFDFSNANAWLGGTLPVEGSDVTLLHSNTVNNNFSPALNQVRIMPGASLILGTNNSVLSVRDLINNGTLSWTSSGTLNISGTLNLSLTAVFTAGNGTVVYNGAGNQLMFTGQTMVNFNNITLGGSGNKSLPAGADFSARNLVVGPGTTFNLSAPGSDIIVQGDLTINGNIVPGSNIFQFTGSADQTISVAGTGTAVFQSVILNKPSGTLLLLDDMQVQESLSMTAGNINTQGKLLELGVSTVSRGSLVYQAGYISGRMRRWFAAATNSGVSSSLFPMGQILGPFWKKRFLSIEYTQAPTTGGAVTVQFRPEPMLSSVMGTQMSIPDNSTGGAGFEVGKFSDDGFWQVDNLAGTLIDGEYTIKATGESFTPLAAVKERMTLVKRVSGGDWFCPGIHLPSEGDLDLTTLARSGVSGYSNYGFAGEIDVPLSIELANIFVNCTGQTPKLTWVTAKESDTKRFIVQESVDGKTWDDLVSVDAACNSSDPKKYTVGLGNLSGAANQVRLVLENLHGGAEKFKPLNIPCTRGIEKSDILVYPNPTTGSFVVDLQQTRDEIIDINVFNSTGQNVYGKMHNAGRHSKVMLDLGGLPSGIYQVVISGSSTGEIPGQILKISKW